MLMTMFDVWFEVVVVFDHLFSHRFDSRLLAEARHDHPHASVAAVGFGPDTAKSDLCLISDFGATTPWSIRFVVIVVATC